MHLWGCLPCFLHMTRMLQQSTYLRRAANQETRNGGAPNLHRCDCPRFKQVLQYRRRGAGSVSGWKHGRKTRSIGRKQVRPAIPRHCLAFCGLENVDVVCIWGLYMQPSVSFDQIVCRRRESVTRKQGPERMFTKGYVIHWVSSSSSSSSSSLRIKALCI